VGCVKAGGLLVAERSYMVEARLHPVAVVPTVAAVEPVRRTVQLEVQHRIDQREVHRIDQREARRIDLREARRIDLREAHRIDLREAHRTAPALGHHIAQALANRIGRVAEARHIAQAAGEIHTVPAWETAAEAEDIPAAGKVVGRWTVAAVDSPAAVVAEVSRCNRRTYLLLQCWVGRVGEGPF